MNLEELMQFMANPKRPPSKFGIRMSHRDHHIISVELNRLGLRTGAGACTGLVNSIGYELTLDLYQGKTEFYELSKLKLVQSENRK